MTTVSTIPEPKQEVTSLEERGMSFACKFLEREGAVIIDKNWRCPAGEIDLVYQDDDHLVFANILAAENCEDEFPADPVIKDDLKFLELMAYNFLKSHLTIHSTGVRFDSITIAFTGERSAFIRFHKDVFGIAGIDDREMF